MATNFPTSVDNFTNPTANDSLNLPSHSTQHANANDAIEAIEGYLLNGGQGLTLIKRQTVGTAVSSVTVSDVFSATYDNYRITMNGGVGSTGIEFWMTLSGIGAGNYYSALHYFVNNAGTPLAASVGPQPNLFWCGAASTNTTQFELEIQSPFLAKHKTGSSKMIPTSVPLNQGMANHWITNTTSATSFTITCNTGTITGGNIYVYGYAK